MVRAARLPGFEPGPHCTQVHPQGLGSPEVAHSGWSLPQRVGSICSEEAAFEKKPDAVVHTCNPSCPGD